VHYVRIMCAFTKARFYLKFTCRIKSCTKTKQKEKQNKTKTWQKDKLWCPYFLTLICFVKISFFFSFCLNFANSPTSIHGMTWSCYLLLICFIAIIIIVLLFAPLQNKVSLIYKKKKNILYRNKSNKTTNKKSVTQ